MMWGRGWRRPSFSQAGDHSIVSPRRMCRYSALSRRLRSLCSSHIHLQLEGQGFPVIASWRASRLPWGMGEHCRAPQEGRSGAQVWRAPSPGFLALPITPDSSSEATSLASGNGSGRVMQAEVPVCLTGTCPEGWHKEPWQTGSEQAQSSHSNLPCGRQRRYRQREAKRDGQGDPPEQLPSLYYQVCRAAPRSPDDIQLDDQVPR